MFIDELENYLKERFKKTPKLKSEFEPLVLYYCYGDYGSFDEIYDLIENEDGSHVSILLDSLSESTVKYIDDVLNKFFENRNLFKNIGLRLNSYKNLRGENYIYSSLEELDDDMTREIEKSKILKFQNSFLKSYKGLANKETSDIFRELYYKKIKREDISKSISKIKGFGTSDLNIALGSLLKNDSIEEYIESIKDKNVEIVSREDNIVIFEVNDYLSSKELGSKQWCISYNNVYWDEYKKKGEFSGTLVSNSESNKKYNDNSIFFIVDKNKKKSDPSHMIGVTTLPSGQIIFVHNKNDDSIINEFELKEYFSEKIKYFLDKKPKNRISIKRGEIFDDINEIKLNSSNPMEDIICYIEENNISGFDIELIASHAKSVTQFYIETKNFNEKLFDKFIGFMANSGLGFSSEILKKMFSDVDFEKKYKKHYYEIEDSIIYEESENVNFVVSENMLSFIGKNNKDGSYFSESIIKYFNKNSDDKIKSFLDKERELFLTKSMLAKLLLDAVYVDGKKMKIVLDYYHKNIESIKEESIDIPFKGIVNSADSSSFLSYNKKNLKDLIRVIKDGVNYREKLFFTKDYLEYRERNDFCKKIELLKSLGLASNKEINEFLEEVMSDDSFEFHPIDKIYFKKKNNKKVMSKSESIEFLRKQYKEKRMQRLIK